MLEDVDTLLSPRGDLMVFAYGSLIWDVPFQVKSSSLASITGFSRRFCMDSVLFRGTFDNPGLVLGLVENPTGCCAGVVYHLGPDTASNGLAILRDRELGPSGYEETLVPARLEDGRVIQALAYVIDPTNRYFRDLSLDQQADIIASATGSRGPNSDYLFNTVSQLSELSIQDPELDCLAAQVSHRLGVHRADHQENSTQSRERVDISSGCKLSGK